MTTNEDVQICVTVLIIYSLRQSFARNHFHLLFFSGNSQGIIISLKKDYEPNLAFQEDLGKQTMQTVHS